MFKLGDFSVKNPVFVNLLMIFVVLVGAISYFFLMPREVFPNVSFDMVQIGTVYPGASPEEIEKLITIPIEDEISDLDGIDHIQSVSQEGFSNIVIFMDPDEEEIRSFRQDVESEVDKVTDLPDDAEDPEIKELEADYPAVNVAFYGDLPEDEMKRWIEEFEDAVEELDGIGEARLFGVRDREFQVELDSRKLEALGLSTDDVVNALRATNLNIPGGTMDTARGEVLVRTLGDVETAEEIENIVVRSSGDLQTVRIGDVAMVEDTFEDEVVRSRVSGQPAMTLVVTKSQSGDVITLVDAVKELVEEYREKVPPGVGIETYQDFSMMVRERLSVMQSNGIVGLIIVLFILYMFLSARMSILVAAGLPVAFLVAIILMNWTGSTINMLSLFGLIMVLGILVDDGIIVAENVYRYREMGLPIKEAAMQGTNEVVAPIFAAVMTTIAAFMPLMLMSGILGKFVRVIPVAVIAALLGSLLECYFVLPSHLADFGEGKPPKEGFFHYWGNLLDPRRKKNRAAKRQGFSGFFRNVDRVFLGVVRGTLWGFFKPIRAILPALFKTLLVWLGLYVFFAVTYSQQIMESQYGFIGFFKAPIAVTQAGFWSEGLSAFIFIGLGIYAVIFTLLSIAEAVLLFLHFLASSDPNPPSKTIRTQLWGEKGHRIPFVSQLIPMPFMGVLAFWLLVVFFPMFIYVQSESEPITQIFFVGLLLLSPLLLVWDKFLRPGFNRFFERARRRYTGVLRYFLRYRYLWFAFMVSLCLFSFVWMGTMMKLELFPTRDIELFLVNVEAPVGTTLDEMEDYVAPIEAMIMEYPPEVIENISTTLGVKQDDDFNAFTYGEQYAQIAVDLQSPKTNPMYGQDVVDELRYRLQREYSGATWEVAEQGGGPPVGKPVNVRIRGENFDVLRSLADEVKEYLETIPGVVEIKDNFIEGKQEYQVILDLERAEALGLDVRTVGLRVRGAFEGIEASEIQTVDEDVKIRVRFREEDRTSLSDLEEMRFVNRSGQMIPLRNFATVQDYRGIDRINRYNQKRTVTVSAEFLDDADITSLEVSKAIEEHFSDLSLRHPGYTFEFGGESEDTQESMISLLKAFALALLLIYVILSTQFKSFVQSLLIISAIPYGLIGVIWGFYAIGEPLGFIAMMGIVALCGVIVNDSIVMMDFINKERDRGQGRWKSILRAASTRLRPVILTTVTTIGGLMTISFGQRGATAFLSPMGLSLIFGMSFGTIITLVTVPCLRAILDDLHHLFERREFKNAMGRNVPKI